MYLLKKRFGCLLIVVVVQVLTTWNVLLAADQFPVPPGATLVAVADDMQYHGIAMQVRKFEIDMPVEAVLNFYRGAWKGNSVEDDLPPWKMISTRAGDEFLTVQVQSAGNGKSWGYLGTSDLPKLIESGYSVKTAKDFPMMNGSQVINDFANNDLAKKGRTLLIANKFSVSGNANYYRNHYREQGWTTVMDETPDSGASQVFVFKRGDRTLNFTINQGEEGYTNIIVNDVKRGLF